MAVKKTAKRLGKKHRQASTRPHKGKAPKATPTTGAVDPRKRKVLAAKKAKTEETKRVARRSPELEQKRTITGDDAEKPARTTPAEPTLPRAQRERAPGRSFRSDSEQQAAKGTRR